ncbi:MAG TPA: protein-methionine-sulfoxide reductase heme-binding subunit MsrQ [Longimicrobiales bacterium]|nr:protein-methionine-sulfoxide reductase heme-binding subunit MsrQ [Longimicrobiales bacterium]
MRKNASASPLRRAIRPLIWAACLIPAAHLAVDALTGGLGVNPIENVTHRTGRWALILLLVTLSFTPARRIFGWNNIIRYRRDVGLASFTYAALHLLTYVTLDLFFDFSLIAGDILKRPFITVGTAAFLLLLPLALTSNRAAIRRLGRRWQLLHRLIYPAAILGIIHFLWLVKAPAIRRPITYGTVLAGLLLFRVAHWLWRQRTAPDRRG